MSAPVADSYTVPAGATAHVGRRGPARATAALPLTGGRFAGSAGAAPSALSVVAAALTPGAIVNLTNSTINAVRPAGSKPWGAVPGVAGTQELLDWASDMPWDSIRRRCYAAGGRPYDTPEAQKFVWFDEQTDVWDTIHQPWTSNDAVGGHLYDNFTLAPELGILFQCPLYSPGGKIHRWDVVNNVDLGDMPRPPPPPGQPAWVTPVSLVWMPTMGSQGSLLFLCQLFWTMCRFDWATQTWTTIKSGAAGDNIHLLGIYLPGADVALMGSTGLTTISNGLNIVTPSGWAGQTSIPPCYLTVNGGSARSIFVPHPDGNSAIAFSYDLNKIFQYIPATNTWVDRGALPSGLANVYLIGTSIPELGVVMFVARESGPAYVSKIYKPDF